MPVIRIYLFGGLALYWDQDPLPPLPGVVARSLLAYLVTYRDRAHTRDLLSGIFWPDLPDAVARRRLSRALWQVRRSLQLDPHPHPLLLTTGDTVQLNPDLPLWLDVAEFERRVSSGKLQELELATELYRGDFLAGYYDDWLLVEREHLREMFLATLERLTEDCKGRGEYERALAHARQLATEAPWREETHREIMRLCHLLGQDAVALKQFEVCRQVLADELGAEPSPETVSLAAEIAERSDVPALPLVPSPARPTVAPLLERPERLPLVCRQSELAELLHQVESAAGGRGGLTVIYGEAGVGKTRLLQELAHNAQWRGLQSVWGRCYELAAPPAYQPLVEALRAGLPALREATLEALWRAELSRLLPELTVGETLPPPLPPDEERRRLLEAIARGFLALTGAYGEGRRITPHLVLLEDAHWMDPASLEALRYLLPRLADAPLQMVLTVRGEELDGHQAGALAALEGTRLLRRLDLDRLDLAATGELVQRALELEQSAPRFSARLHAETDGNPFYVLETLRALVDEGLLRRDADGTWSTPWDESTEDYAELPLPAGVRQTVECRLDRLPATLRELLGLAAVIGRGVAFDLWLQASDRDEEKLLVAGDALCARGLLLAAEPDYVFAHDQVRRVTYDRLAAPRRRLYHRQVAQALARLVPDEPEALAYHWTRAEVWNQAADYHQQAGDRARAVYANAAAVTHYTQALEALERLPGSTDPLRSFELLLAREAVYGLLGERTAQVEDLTTLETLAEQLGDNRRRAEVALHQATYARSTGDYSAAIAAAQAAIDLAQDEEDQAQAYLTWGRSLTLQGEYEMSRTQLGQALALAREQGVRQVEADSLRSLGIASWYQGDYAGARDYYEQSLRIFHQIGDRRGASASLNNLGMVSWSLGDNAGARDYYEQSLHIKREIGDRKGESAVLNNLGNIPWSQSDYAGARDHYEQSLHIKREIGDRKGEGLTVLNLGIVFACLGDYAGARDYYEQSLHICREIGDRQNEGLTLTSLGLLSHHLGDDETALRYNQQALLIAKELGDRSNHRHTLICMGHALTGLGRLDEATDVYQGALDIGRELGQYSQLPDVLAGLARVSLTRGELSQAQEHVGEILSHLETNPTLDGTDAPFFVYLTCYCVLRAIRDLRAQEVLATAYNLLQEQAAKIPDEATRRSFLEDVAANREIIVTYRELQGERITVRLPRADAPSGRPLRDDEYTSVTWTMNAPGDQDIPRRTARRRHRILRLVREAQAQDAAPRDRDLATALGVSLPTIRRDMAALRDQGHDLPTRGRKRIT